MLPRSFRLNSFISIVGASYCQPLMDLIERLLALRARREEKDTLSPAENGYACAAVLLLALIAESFVQRVVYLQHEHLKPKPTHKRPPDFMGGLSKSFRLRKSLHEVFVLRNAIAHNHVWEGTKARSGYAAKAKLLNGYGNEDLRRVLKATTRKSKAAGLHLMPTEVDARDVERVFSIVQRTLDFLVAKKYIEASAIRYRGRFEGKPFDFWEVGAILRGQVST
jgi:hypothetical protein